MKQEEALALVTYLEDMLKENGSITLTYKKDNVEPYGAMFDFWDYGIGETLFNAVANLHEKEEKQSQESS